MAKVVEYQQTYFPIEVSTTPLISADEAGENALNALMEPGAVVVSVKGPSVLAPDALGVERLVWQATVEGYELVTQEHRWGQYLAYVDAHTGELIYYDTLMGVHARSAKVPPRAPTTAVRAAADGGATRSDPNRAEGMVSIEDEVARPAYRPLLVCGRP
jgi:hypothetical protein